MMNTSQHTEHSTLNYEDYLQRQGYAKTTAKNHLEVVSKFIQWSDSKNHELETIDYKLCLDYVKQLQNGYSFRKRVSQKTIKTRVGSLKIYFNYLVDTNQRPTNPIQNINIRGVKQSLNHNLLEYAELEDLYYSYPTENLRLPNCKSVAIRNKVITGFMVYQGMNTTALKSLRFEDVNVDKGTIYIPSTRKTNSRKLELKSQQILSLVRYLETHREILQEKIQCHDRRLFPITGDRFYITHEIFKTFKKINFNVKDIKQVRASVITYWLQHHNLREVQYMAGHRYISSTEAYVQDDLESLHQFIDDLHPIG